MCGFFSFLTNALRHKTPQPGAFAPGTAAAGLCYTWMMPPEQTAAALGPGAGRALGGELDLLRSRRGEKRRRRRGKAATAVLPSLSSSWVRAGEGAGAQGVKANPRYGAARHGAAERRGSASGRTRSSCPAKPRRGRELPRGVPARQERFAFVSQPKLELCGYRCALPLLPPWSTSD